MWPKELGCSKVALGHHGDDAVETFVMNLFNEGRIGCFSPVTYMSRKDLHVIRPLIYARERDVLHAVRTNDLPVVKSVCPVDEKTNRPVDQRVAAGDGENPSRHHHASLWGDAAGPCQRLVRYIP